MAASARRRGDSIHSAGRPGWISTGGRSYRMGQPENSPRASAGNIARPGDHHLRRRAAIGVGGNRGILSIAISPAGDSLRAENRIRRGRTGGAHYLSQQVGCKKGSAMRRARTNTLPLRTPEGIVFALPLAGPVSRLLAWSLDIACIGAASEVVGRLLNSIGMINRELAQATYILAYFVISIGYGIAFEWFWRGQTLGKRVLGLRVMDEQALRLEFSQVAVRNLLRVVDS